MTQSELLKVWKTNFRSNPNVGLYVYVTDKYCLAGPEVPDEDYTRLAEIFGVPVHRFTMAGTGLLGAFLAGTNNMLLVPSIMVSREEKILEKLGIAFTVIKTDLTALGNNILCNDNGCLVNDEYTEVERKAIQKALGVPVKAMRVAEVPIIGSCGVATNRGCLMHRALKPFEAEMIQDTLGVPVATGSVNLGNPYIKAGLAGNKHGMIVGDLSGGPEIVNAEEALRGEQ